MIVTFYSYKGGVGRSMAMANVARWFQMQGLNVAMIDWDLEAPGLESFFSQDKSQLGKWRSRVGLTDLVTLYKNDFPSLALSESAPAEDAQALRADVLHLSEVLSPLKFALFDLPAPPTRVADASSPAETPPGRLQLLSAGWREGAERFASYANAVQSIDWTELYDRYRGYAYVEWMRRSLSDPGLADVVLIDSRTGVTEMGGVCTRHLADLVVVMSAPNRQNIEGAASIAPTFKRPRLQLWERPEPEIEVMLVPSRIDLSSSSVKSAFEPLFREHAKAFTPPALPEGARELWDLRIPYVDAYAFEERLAVGEPDADPDLVAAYKRIAAHIAWLAPAGSRMRHAMRPEFVRQFGLEAVRARESDSQFEDAWARVPEDQGDLVRELLLRLVEVGNAAEDGDRARSVRLDEMVPTYERAAQGAIEAGLALQERGSDGVGRLALAEADFAQHSPLAGWVDERRDWLAWLQRLRTYLSDWERSSGDPAALLQGSLLQEAEAMARQGRLLPQETSFIAVSRDVADATRRALEAAALNTGSPAAVPVSSHAHPPTLPTPPRSRLATLPVVLVAIVVAIAGAFAWWGSHRAGSADLASVGPASAPDRAAAELQAAIGNAKRLADASDVQGAVAQYSRALQIDPNSLPALLGRADANGKLAQSSAALADLGRAIALAPDQIQPLVQRAELHARNTELQAALTDVDAAAAIATRTGTPLDTPTLMLRANLLDELGQPDALQAYDTVIQAGGSTEGYLGKGSVLERNGRKADAIAAYQQAISTASDERLRTLAQARLSKLSPQTPIPVAVNPVQVVLQIVTPGNDALAQDLGNALAKSGLRMAQKNGRYVFERVDRGTTRGDVRYFYQEDSDLARRTRQATQDALAARGVDLTLTLLYTNPAPFKPGSAPRGRVEVWLPSQAFSWGPKGAAY